MARISSADTIFIRLAVSRLVGRWSSVISHQSSVVGRRQFAIALKVL
jgi:hypothetical protein